MNQPLVKEMVCYNLLQPAIIFAWEMEDMIKLQAIMTLCTLLLCTWLPGNLGGIQAQGQMPGSSMLAFYQHPYFTQFVGDHRHYSKQLFFMLYCATNMYNNSLLTGLVLRISLCFTAITWWIDSYTLNWNFFNHRVKFSVLLVYTKIFIKSSIFSI